MFQVGGSLCCSGNAYQSVLIALLYPTISFELSDAGHPLNVNQLAVPCVNWVIRCMSWIAASTTYNNNQVNCIVQK